MFNKPVVAHVWNPAEFIVNEPGLYRTRSGNHVNVHEVKPYGSDLSVMKFTVKGNLIEPRPGKRDLSTFNIWHPTGAKVAVGQTNDDIVSRVV